MDKISERLKLNKNGYLSHADFELGHLFEEFYNAKDKESITYFRVKAIDFYISSTNCRAMKKLNFDISTKNIYK